MTKRDLRTNFEPGADDGNDTRRTEDQFSLIMVCWGARYIQYLTTYWLPSLLAPGNLPSLGESSPHEIAIATDQAGWHSIVTHPAAKAAMRYVTFRHVQLPLPPPGADNVVHMSEGHRRLFLYCYETKRIAIPSSPDSIFSENAIYHLSALAKRSVDLAVLVTMRAKECGFFKSLEEFGVLSPSATDGISLSATSSQLIEATLRNPHPEMQSWTVGDPSFANPTAVIFRSRQTDVSAVIHCFEWLPILIRFSAIEKLNVSDFPNSTYAANFIANNFNGKSVIEVIQNPHDMMLGTWTPGDEAVPSLARRSSEFWPRPIARYIDGLIVQYRYDLSTPLHRWLFHAPTCWFPQPDATDALSVLNESRRFLRDFISARPPARPKDSLKFEDSSPRRGVRTTFNLLLAKCLWRLSARRSPER